MDISVKCLVAYVFNGWQFLAVFSVGLLCDCSFYEKSTCILFLSAKQIWLQKLGFLVIIKYITQAFDPGLTLVL